MPARITIYGRPGCHLCDEAEAKVADLAVDSGAVIEVVNIEHDDQLHRAMLELIPVIELNGVRISKLVEYRGEPFEAAVREGLIT
ncbi:MAG: glutaredoxin family protein [Thermoleophilaceae bacterium]|nr:glutaredoxin family protein [Thermoleophilaceae bacterium]